MPPSTKGSCWWDSSLTPDQIAETAVGVLNSVCDLWPCPKFSTQINLVNFGPMLTLKVKPNGSEQRAHLNVVHCSEEAWWFPSRLQSPEKDSLSDVIYPLQPRFLFLTGSHQQIIHNTYFYLPIFPENKCLLFIFFYHICQSIKARCKILYQLMLRVHMLSECICRSNSLGTLRENYCIQRFWQGTSGPLQS